MLASIARTALGVAITLGSLVGAMAPITANAWGAPITEDSPEWNCAVMGDRQCGLTHRVIEAAPAHCYVVPVVNDQGVPVRLWLQNGAYGPELCGA